MSEEMFDEDFMDGPEEMEIPDEVEEEAAISFTQDAADADPAKLGLTDAQRRRWSRPAVPAAALDPSQSTLNMQWLDIDMIGGQPLPSNPNPSKRKMVGARAGQVPVIRIFGVTDAGNSVAAYIHGYTPYGYFGLPDGFEVDGSEENLAEIRRFLNDRLREKVGGRGGGANGGAGADDDAAASAFCHGVQYIDDHASIMGFSATHTKFLKVFVGMPTMIPKLKTIMESEGHNVPGLRSAGGGGSMGCQLQPFECNVPFVLRFMIDRDITGAGWLTLPEGTYSLRREEAQKQTHCQLEVDVAFNEIVAHKPEGEWNKIAPLRVLSLDIECQGRKGHFPEAEQDPVIQIANAVSVYGNNDGPIVQNVFTLRGCLPIVGAQVIPSDTEEDMLLKWRAFLQAADADIITGYNVQVSSFVIHVFCGIILVAEYFYVNNRLHLLLTSILCSCSLPQNFDIPYLLDRAETLMKKKGGKRNLSVFRQWGRIKNGMAKMRETMFQSSAYGRRANVETTIDGRVIFDMLPYMQRNHKLSSYSLNSVCSEFLGQQKEDVHHSIISDLQNGTDEDRHRLATYCLKDALLPQRLMDKLSVLVNYIEMARVTGVPVSFLIARGQQIKVFSMILRKCRNEKLLVPTLAKTGGGGDVGYEGATVLDPIKNYYEVPIATLDFASLYPSIMQAYNLCYSTMVSPQDVATLDPSQYNKSDNGHIFVKSDTKKGILPTILGELLSARKRAKKDMKNAPTEFEKAVQNGRQLALKVSANSVYGFTGANVGQLPCLPIASSVTSYGRQLLEKTKAFVEEKYTTANGYKYDAEVVYGDTDSVMVKFGTKTVEETFPLAIEAADKCSEIFPSPILLEFEKVYFPYLLMNKKRYAGLMWTNTDKYDYMDTKGLETVRRDNCALVREVIQTSLDKILINQDVQGAIDYVKNQISDLLQNKMDISRLVITKSLNKGAEYALGLGGKKEDYKVKQAHVELAARMKKRDAGSAPQMGDRVPYVIITGIKGAANFEKAEDPIYVLENNIPIDCKWYLTNQLSKPLTRIFEPIIENVDKTLLKGDHTRKVFVPTPTARKGSLMMFASKKAKCMGCKTPIEESMGNLCKYCIPKEAEIYLEKLGVLREAQFRYAKLWAEAQRIHGTLHTDIMCTGDGCACNFYRRKKVQMDIKLAQDVLDKFGR
jgi:DNA polymerase delta subunit 1